MGFAPYSLLIVVGTAIALRRCARAKAVRPRPPPPALWRVGGTLPPVGAAIAIGPTTLHVFLARAPA
eukprot:9006064-Lingulodinium_polyedra.AAC.1